MVLLQVIASVETCEKELAIITRDVDKYWNDPSSTQWQKLDILKVTSNLL